MSKFQYLLPLLFFLTLADTSHFSIISPSKFLSASNSNSTTTENSFSYAGPFFGCVFILFALLLLWYNEKGYLISGFRKENALKSCIELDPNTLSLENEGQLVYLNHFTSCGECVCDPMFPLVSSSYGIKLIRKVEMYQWSEARIESNSHHQASYYRYTEWWSENFFDSESFKESNYKNNSKNFVLRSEKIMAKEVRIGRYILSEELKEMTQSTIITPNEEIIKNASAKLLQDIKEIGKELQMDQEYIYICKDKSNLQIGDVRIQFLQAKCGPTTIVGQLQSPTFIKYHCPEANPNDDYEGGFFCCLCFHICQWLEVSNKSISEILWIFENDDIVSKEEAFSEKKERRNSRNVRRIYAWVIICLGLWMFFGPNVYLLDAFPFFSSMVKNMGSWTAFVFGLIEGGVLSVVMIGFVWIFYRPGFSALLILLGIGIGIGILYI